MPSKTKTNINPQIHIGADHRGYILKYELKKFLEKNGYRITDHGSHEYQVRDDYPNFAKLVSKSIKNNSVGILICGSGIGMDIAANRHRHIRAGLCWNKVVAAAGRNDDDINILVLPADFVSWNEAKKIVTVFLETKFSGLTKHIRRIKKISKIK